MVLNFGHLDSTYIMAFIKYRMMIQHTKCSYIECKQKDLHLLLKSDPKLFWKSFKGKYDSTLPLHHNKQQIIAPYCTPYDKLSMSILFQNSTSLSFSEMGNIWALMRDLANHKARYIHMLKHELLEWVGNDLYESITRAI